MKFLLKYTAVLFLLLGWTTAMSAENKPSKKCRKILKEAHKEYSSGNYLNSWRLYKDVLRIDDQVGEASALAASSALKLRYPVDSILFLKESLAATKYKGSQYYLAWINHQQRRFDDAIKLLTEYKNEITIQRPHSDEEIAHLLSYCTNAKEMIASPHLSVIKNMGANINSPYPDYVPVILPDESALFFTSKRPGSLHPAKNNDNSYFEDVFVSYRWNGIWSAAENLGYPVNTETNDGCVAISPDGQRMIVYRTSEDLVTGDLYLSRLGKGNRWSPLELMGDQINSPHVETSACFSHDSSEIYFSSDRPGGFGGKDIYRIRKMPNGNWSQPFNLGKNVNTPYDEDAPFLHADRVSLYFSSKGHNSMGEYDVFKSTLNRESNEYSLAENLGYPINDVSDDIFFVLSVDGQRGYYSSVKKESLGGIDIYQIDTRFGDNDLKVKQGVSYLDDKPAQAKIILMENGEMIGSYLSNPSTGRFILVVNPLKSYTASVEAPGYETQEVTIPAMVNETKNQVLKFKLKKAGAQ